MTLLRVLSVDAFAVRDVGSQTVWAHWFQAWFTLQTLVVVAPGALIVVVSAADALADVQVKELIKGAGSTVQVAVFIDVESVWLLRYGDDAVMEFGNAFSTESIDHVAISTISADVVVTAVLTARDATRSAYVSIEVQSFFTVFTYPFVVIMSQASRLSKHRLILTVIDPWDARIAIRAWHQPTQAVHTHGVEGIRGCGFHWHTGVTMLMQLFSTRDARRDFKQL